MQMIIIGGGNSILEGIKLGLLERLNNKFTCGINYSYRYFKTTYLCCMNYVDFYNANREELKKLPLIVTCNRPHPSIWEKNTVTVKEHFTLSGILALSVACKLLNADDEIFLLGYDYGAYNGKTHFYQDKIHHRGVNKTAYYDYEGHAERDFRDFNSNIYNVSINSRINVFPKLSYEQFFCKLATKEYKQEALRKAVRKSLK